MSNAEVTLDTGRARELTQMCAELELPYEVATGCGAKAIAIMSLLRVQRVQREAIGVAMLYTPDLSPEGIRAAETTGKSMHFKQSPYSFPRRLETGIGTVDVGIGAVEWGGVRFTEAQIEGESCVQAKRLVPIGETHAELFADQLGRDQWLLPLPDEEVHMCNHTATMLWGKIIDPGYEKDRPLSPEEWRECLNFSDAVLLSTKAETDAKTPFHTHAELMPPAQRSRYDWLLEENKVNLRTIDYNLLAYQAVMRGFFNLRNNAPPENSSLEWEASQYLAKTILVGDQNYVIPPDASCEANMQRRIDRLNLPMIYQRWMKETGAILDAQAAAL